MDHQNYCIKWKKQMHHLQNALAGYIDDQLFCDVTLASEGEVFNAHQFVLSACSPCFQNILRNVPTNKHPVIFLNDVSPLEIKTLLDYMYKGQVALASDLVPSFLKTCERLQIQGLCNQTYEKRQNTVRHSNSEHTTGLTKEKTREFGNFKSTRNINAVQSSRVTKETNQVQLGSDNSDNLNQEITCQKRKRKKTDPLAQNPKELQSTCENDDTLHSLSERDKGIEQIQLPNADSVSLNQERKRQSKQNYYSRTKQTKHNIDVTTEISTSKPLLSLKTISLPLVPAQDTAQITPDLSDAETTQADIPTIANKNKEVNHSESSTVINHNNILDSPRYSQESFVFSDNKLNISKSPDGDMPATSPNMSLRSVIIQDVQPNVIEISDDESETINNIQAECHTEFSREDSDVLTKAYGSNHFILNDPKDISESMVVHLDGNTQAHKSPDIYSENLPKTQDSQSDESEIIIRRKNNYRNRNLSNSSDEVSRFEEEILPASLEVPSRVELSINDNPTNSEVLKAEALSRARNMKIVLNKDLPKTLLKSHDLG